MNKLLSLSVVSFLLTYLSFPIHATTNEDTELVVRLSIASEIADDNSQNLSVYFAGVPINHYKGAALIFEERKKSQSNSHTTHDYTYNCSSQSGLSGIGKNRQDYHWAARVMFGPQDKKVGIGIIRNSKKEPKIKIDYIKGIVRELNKKGEEVYIDYKYTNQEGIEPIRLEEKTSSDKLHFNWTQRSVFEWVLPNGLPNRRGKGLTDIVNFFSDGDQSFRKNHSVYETTLQNCTTFSVNVLSDLGLLPGYKIKDRDPGFYRCLTSASGLTTVASIGTAIAASLTPIGPVFWGAAALATLGTAGTAGGVVKYKDNTQQVQYVVDELIEYVFQESIKNPLRLLEADIIENIDFLSYLNENIEDVYNNRIEKEYLTYIEENIKKSIKHLSYIKNNTRPLNLNIDDIGEIFTSFENTINNAQKRHFLNDLRPDTIEHLNNLIDAFNNNRTTNTSILLDSIENIMKYLNVKKKIIENNQENLIEIHNQVINCINHLNDITRIIVDLSYDNPSVREKNDRNGIIKNFNSIRNIIEETFYENINNIFKNTYKEALERYIEDLRDQKQKIINEFSGVSLEESYPKLLRINMPNNIRSDNSIKNGLRFVFPNNKKYIDRYRKYERDIINQAINIRITDNN